MTFYFLPYEKLSSLLDNIKEQYRLIGPTVNQAAILYKDISNVDELPWGMVDEQKPGSYQLQKTNNKQVFGWVNGPQAIKPELFKAKESLWRVARDETGRLSFKPVEPLAEKLALFAVRPCDLHAMSIQDKVFIESKYQDVHYKKRRENLFIVVANCTRSSNNCFCVSAGGSPRAQFNFDIAMTEIKEGFLMEPATQQGELMLETLALNYASEMQRDEMLDLIARAEAQQKKQLPKTDLRKALFNNLSHPRWQEVAERCLSCGNCTQVCPTCFCHREVENPALSGEESEHIREWDSCFTLKHSHIHGKDFRDTTMLRYRQWLTHKFGSWHDQFGTSGCVGCGRCITWCPTGIDVTEELNEICGEDKA